MDPHDFLDVARELVARDRPAYERTAITRAYYAVYNVACDLFQALGFEIERGHAGHQVIRNWLRYSGVDRLVQVGAQLRRLHNVRVKADYWMQDPQPDRRITAERWVAHATRLIASMDAVLTGPAARERVRRAVTAWEQGRTGRTP